MEVRLKKVSGIYVITHLKNGKQYIGSATCLYTRLHNHYSQLSKGDHCNIKLQRIFNKYGKLNLIWGIIEICGKKDLIKREQFYIDTLKPELNICRFAQNTLGYRHSDEMKKIFSESRKGNKNSLGRKLSAETKYLISEKAKKRGLHEAFKSASIKANTGRVHSAEEIRNRSIAQSKINPFQAQVIRNKRKLGAFQHELAKEYGVSQRLIARVEHGLGIYGDPEYFEAGNKRFLEQTAQQNLFGYNPDLYGKNV